MAEIEALKPQARSGDMKVQYALARLYHTSQFGSRDLDLAYEWYSKAAEQGHPVAQYLLGSMYQEGWAGDYDPVEAYKWFTLAHRQRDRVLTDNPKLDTRAALDGVGKGMNQDQIKRAEDAVRNWRPNR